MEGPVQTQAQIGQCWRPEDSGQGRGPRDSYGGGWASSQRALPVPSVLYSGPRGQGVTSKGQADPTSWGPLTPGPWAGQGLAEGAQRPPG